MRHCYSPASGHLLASFLKEDRNTISRIQRKAQEGNKIQKLQREQHTMFKQQYADRNPFVPS